jgi:hypothetical protein
VKMHYDRKWLEHIRERPEENVFPFLSMFIALLIIAFIILSAL